MMKIRSTMLHVRVNTELKRKATEALTAMGLTAADAVRLLFHRIAADQAFPLELKVPNTETRRAIVELEEMVETHPAGAYPPNRPPIPLDVPWADYWQALQECDAWWKQSPEDFSIFPPGKSWVGVIRKLRPTMSQDWSRFDPVHQKRLLGCAAPDDDDWALLGNLLGCAIGPVFGHPTTRRSIETTVKSVIAVENSAFLKTATSAYASLTQLDRIGPARATRLLTLARPDCCVSLNSPSEHALATYGAKAPIRFTDPKSYGRLLQRIHQQPWFGKPKSGFGSPMEKEAWSMRVALLDAFIYLPRTR